MLPSHDPAAARTAPTTPASAFFDAYPDGILALAGQRRRVVCDLAEGSASQRAHELTLAPVADGEAALLTTTLESMTAAFDALDAAWRLTTPRSTSPTTARWPSP